MSDRREALAHAFVAGTLAVTREWPAELQVELHRLAFAELPVEILALRPAAARRWVQAWRTRLQPTSVMQPFELSAEQIAWIAELVAAPAVGAEEAPAGEDLDRLARLLERLGPVALSLPWRGTAAGKA